MQYVVRADTYVEFVSKVKKHAKKGALAFMKSVSHTATYIDDNGHRHQYRWVKTDKEEAEARGNGAIVVAPESEIKNLKNKAIGVVSIGYLFLVGYMAYQAYLLVTKLTDMVK